MSYNYPFPMTSTTATILVIYRNSSDYEASCYCVGQRSNDVDIHPNQMCIPGGFLNARYELNNLPGEDILDTAVRELWEEMGIRVNRKDLVLYGQNSDPTLDPRAHVVNLWFWVEINDEQYNNARAGDDIQKLSWHWVGENQVGLAFNHDELLKEGLEHWRKEQAIKLLLQNINSSKLHNNSGFVTNSETALAVMRIQPLHLGHLFILNKMTADYNTVILGIGSQNSKRTKSNPWTGEERMQMVRNIFGNRIKIVPLSDLGASQGSDDWVEYVLQKTHSLGLPNPTSYLTGSVSDSIWYKNRFWDGPENAGALKGATKFYTEINGETKLRKLLIIDRSQNMVPAATELRSFLETRNDGWKKWVPAVNHNLIESTYPEEFKVRLG